MNHDIDTWLGEIHKTLMTVQAHIKTFLFFYCRSINGTWIVGLSRITQRLYCVLLRFDPQMLPNSSQEELVFMSSTDRD